MAFLTDVNRQYIQTIRNYMCLTNAAEKADCIFLPWSSYTKHLPYVANLYHQWYAKYILCSGKWSPYLDHGFEMTEEEHYATVLIKSWVPDEYIIRERKATNTWENFRFGYKALHERNCRSILIIQKPFFARRAQATAQYEHYKNRRPEKIIAHAQPMTMDEYNATTSKKNPSWIDILVGDLHRIIVGNRQKRIVHQEIPNDVIDSYVALITKWYTQMMMQWFDFYTGNKIE